MPRGKVAGYRQDGDSYALEDCRTLQESTTIRKVSWGWIKTSLEMGGARPSSPVLLMMHSQKQIR
jgi:hypothetical protein